MAMPGAIFDFLPTHRSLPSNEASPNRGIGPTVKVAFDTSRVPAGFTTVAVQAATTGWSLTFETLPENCREVEAWRSARTVRVGPFVAPRSRSSSGAAIIANMAMAARTDPMNTAAATRFHPNRRVRRPPFGLWAGG